MGTEIQTSPMGMPGARRLPLVAVGSGKSHGGPEGGPRPKLAVDAE
jgi:hypothetical protein